MFLTSSIFEELGGVPKFLLQLPPDQENESAETSTVSCTVWMIGP